METERIEDALPFSRSPNTHPNLVNIPCKLHSIIIHSPDCVAILIDAI